jgi:hypothetical protein
MMILTTEMNESSYRSVPNLDVCPPVQEDFDCPEVAFASSIVECGATKLSSIPDNR